MHDAHDHDSPECCATCATCGSPAEPSDRHVRFTWPDPVLSLSEQERTENVWLSHDTATSSVMMEAPGPGSFVRVLLPLRLDDGTSVTYGTWLAVRSDEMRRAFTVWLEPAYVDLRLEGHLANDIAPGGVLGAEASALVRDEDHTPYLHASTHPLLNRMITQTSPAALHA
ncbi:hypothetical protein CLV92_1082 [Kineococcus xinjiangensis]|uniref:DUF2199 domain-containing protein n=1 Tax=Kineococcus xinjiangensis TaxID=512762 RepID=A0A2S6IIU3_9ACTN|nr:DUF2199 domain-containing protein [Kineococcus xinjiangensis]PPK94106.1 hypothetical protein CLV92_1082 [Kineococcus xinjiangensis]